MAIMPQVVGLEYGTAQASLQAAGVLVLGSIGYFGTFPISALWVASKAIPSTVLAQSVASGATVAANAPITLTMSEFPISVAFP